ncbi:uncharacterized protein HGUI_03509 [Hanseniaspora guilliermondii]|uniref:Uncharacterized protein n=1 Tax=Hanseniaspora guilliermondii TaxID=56406 RepID=A0A1L0CQN4_9ASCO|nr:uncharacterized protein HGUI_03509 [Hanseniaspora guilliermondii]
MCKSNLYATNYKSYYFKKLSVPLTKINHLNYIDNFEDDMEIDTDENLCGNKTSFSLDDTTVSSISENLSENKEENGSKNASDITNTNMESRKLITVLKTDKDVSKINELTRLINIDVDLLDSNENPSIMYHLNTSESDDMCNKSTYSYSSDESESIQKYCELNNVYFTNSKYKCKHDMDIVNNKCKMPRQFQHHIITDLDKQHYENVLPFVQASFGNKNQDVLIKSKVYKNFKCPKTACLEEEFKSLHMNNLKLNKSKQEKICNKIHGIILKDVKEFEREEKKNLFNLITWRYSRRLLYLKKTNKFTKETYEETEYMCRLCKGKNWINNTLYFKHLFEEHGITTSLKNKTPAQHSIDIDSTIMIDCIQKKYINRDLLKYVRVKLLPLPLRMFVDFKKNHTDARYFLQCGICFKYIKSGTNENTSFGKYFREHLLNNQCAYFNEPCYILGY